MTLQTSSLISSIVGAALWSTTAYSGTYEVTVTNLTSGVHLTPLIVAAHPSDFRLFTTGQPASPELQAIAEGGDVSSMAALLEGQGAVVATGGGLLAPGSSETLTISTADNSGNDFLSIASMLLPTNDGFIGLNGFNLSQLSGVVDLDAYDAGTEGNDEIVGTTAVGERGFPAPPPVVATGLGSGGTGYTLDPEGFVHIHRGVHGDRDAEGGATDINALVHRWLNPVARVRVRMIDAGPAGPGAVPSLTALDYSVSAVEIFWEPAVSADSIVTGYEVSRDGELLATIDALSFFEENLDSATTFEYTVTPIDAEGRAGTSTSVSVSTR